MGIRTFTFNGESSDTYDILITQNASFNAPERAGEMLSIPGRNGAFWQDYGRFENVEVTYHCAVGEGSKADFVQAMSDVRSWLCSPIGYCRLEDDYNPSEYRMAVYKSGLETDEPFVTGAEFDIVFECKPQRFLKSGETAVSVTSGDTITNPTRFDAQPQLQTWGYGSINIGGQSVVLEYINIGDTLVAGAVSNTKYLPCTFDMCNTGDDLTLHTPTKGIATFVMPVNVSGISCTEQNHPINTTISAEYSGKKVVLTINFPEVSAIVGTTSGYSISYSISINNGAYTGTFSCPIGFNSSGVTLSPGVSISGATNTQVTGQFGEFWVYSTLSANGSPTYIDLENGEAYIIKNGFAVSVNNSVQIPAELPTLVSGTNTITYDNTFTQFKVVPRWWKV